MLPNEFYWENRVFILTKFWQYTKPLKNINSKIFKICIIFEKSVICQDELVRIKLKFLKYQYNTQPKSDNPSILRYITCDNRVDDCNFEFIILKFSTDKCKRTKILLSHHINFLPAWFQLCAKFHLNRSYLTIAPYKPPFRESIYTK